MEKSKYIWMDGKLVGWDEAKVHILTHSLHYGLGVFEGIRCYQTYDGKSAVFRLPEHIRRLFDSAKIALMASEMPLGPYFFLRISYRSSRSNTVVFIADTVA